MAINYYMKADLHIHTSYSYDSTASPEEMVEAALQKGINCLAVCDHGEIKGAQKVAEYAKGKPILIIPGIEIKSKEGDILGLNIKEAIPNKLSAEETVKKIKELGGLAIIPHPFGWFCSFEGNLENLASEISGIEALNASIFGRGNRIASDFVKKHGIPFTAGSDAHFPNFVGRCYLEIPGENLSPEEVLKAIKNKIGRIGGSEAGFLEKIIDHVKRNLVKLRKVFKF